MHVRRFFSRHRRFSLNKIVIFMARTEDIRGAGELGDADWHDVWGVKRMKSIKQIVRTREGPS